MASLAFALDLPLGRCVGVSLPAEDDDAGLEALAAELEPAERAHAAGLPGGRRATWIGGRVALRAALRDLGLLGGPILVTPRGAPALPADVVGSISHKRTLAVALAAAAPYAAVTVGIDVELDRAPRHDISRRVLTAGERARLPAADPVARGHAMLVAFAAKEAIYKALDPWLRRSMSFQEVELERDAAGALSATFAARAGESTFFLEVHEEKLPGLVLVAARARPGS